MGFGELEQSDSPTNAGILVSHHCKRRIKKKKGENKPLRQTLTPYCISKSQTLRSSLTAQHPGKWEGASNYTPAQQVYKRRSQPLQENLTETQMHRNTRASTLPSPRKIKEAAVKKTKVWGQNPTPWSLLFQRMLQTERSKISEG